MKSKVKNTPTNIYVPREKIEPINYRPITIDVKKSSPYYSNYRYSEEPINPWLKNYKKRQHIESKSVEVRELNSIEKSLQHRLQQIKISPQDIRHTQKRSEKRSFFPQYNPRYQSPNPNLQTIKQRNKNVLDKGKVTFESQIDACDSLLKDLGVKCKRYIQNSPFTGQKTPTTSVFESPNKKQYSKYYKQRSHTQQIQYPSRSRFISLETPKSLVGQYEKERQVKSTNQGYSVDRRKRRFSIVPYINQMRAKSRMLYQKIKHYKAQTSLK